uniref:Uncharacterized protein n=1 Tax=Anguilla anguilla TaxID=7936 RepID=A0A0E9V6S1_ANGAN
MSVTSQMLQYSDAMPQIKCFQVQQPIHRLERVDCTILHTAHLPVPKVIAHEKKN